MSDDRSDFEELAATLVANFGWSEEESKKFLADKVGVRGVQLDARYLPLILPALSKIGVPFGSIQLNFLVPNSRWDEFHQAAQEAMAPEGGFVLTPEQKVLMGGSDSGEDPRAH